MQSNKRGNTFFLENSVSWLAQIKTENPTINGHLIKYNTLRNDWKELLEGPQVNLMLTLPAFMKDIVYDIIFVDGPAGYNDSTPGRMQSIYTASVLSVKSENIDVFVHDCDREVEKIYCDRFLSDMKLVAEFDWLMHYKKAQTDAHLKHVTYKIKLK